MYIHYNPNPIGAYTEDCVPRAISFITGRSWEDVYVALCIQGYLMKNMPSANRVWGLYLESIGYIRERIPETCPNCYTVRDFCADNPFGTYMLSTGSHVVAVFNGDYYDAWDSGDEVPIDVWRRA